MLNHDFESLRGARVTISDRLASSMAADASFAQEVHQCLQRLYRQDWGDLSPRAQRSNSMLLAQHLEPLLGLYNTSRGKLAVALSTYRQDHYQRVDIAFYKDVYDIYRA